MISNQQVTLPLFMLVDVASNNIGCNSLFHRNKFVEFDMKPVCKKCYEKFPLELKKRLKKLSETVARK